APHTPPPPLLPYTTLFRSSDTTVSLFSSNTKVLNVTQSTVLITSGEFVQLADYTTGLVPGSASVTASASGFASGVTTLPGVTVRSEEHTSELQSRVDLVCR